ncbi:pyridoxal phosphate-dependent aminotransferase [Sporomusa aerivorans]|uniref:pyridoxal phosphate-dependent aminotransferase n=1 Tax=Sporomusa aerivorans TaxID=204936 RepID=UPI00352AF1D5
MTNVTVAERLNPIPFAGIRKVFEKANQLEASGQKVIHFEIGRPDFDTPAHIKAAAKLALDQGLVHYTPNSGLPALRQALAGRLNADKGLTYSPDTEIIMTAGGQEALYLSFLSILNEGDEVILPDPCFGPFPLAVRLAGGVPVKIGLQPQQNYCYDFAAVKKALSPKTKAIVVNSPHNPTGGVWSEDQLKTVAALATERGIWLICDDAYDNLVYEGCRVSPAGFAGLRERTILCGSLSKTYAMTGWRIGYIAAAEPVINAAIRLQQNIMLSLCSFAQYGAMAGLAGPQDCVRTMAGEFARRRNLVLAMIHDIPGLQLDGFPGGAFYAFPRITLPNITSAQVADYLLDHAGVAVVDGLAFGEKGNGHFRLSYAVAYEDCREGLERIAEAMKTLAQKCS